MTAAQRDAIKKIASSEDIDLAATSFMRDVAVALAAGTLSDEEMKKIGTRKQLLAKVPRSVIDLLRKWKDSADKENVA